MCGFAGVAGGIMTTDERRATVHRMMDRLSHRGPDGEGLFVDEASGLALGHRRLAIIDPEHGAQPMTTPDGELTIVFNGEIYNYLELRRELVANGHRIRSFSDTEVILHAYREWGEACVDRFIGMFAFVIWDQQAKRLFGARDRIGIKPFYYYHNGSTLAFASEIKALLATGIFKAEPRNDALIDYLTFQFCLGEKTLFRNVVKLEPGHMISAKLSNNHWEIKIRKYWDVSYEIDSEHDEAWFVEELSSLIEDSMRMHLRSDVSLGAHLSGGLDSSTVVCLASKLLHGQRIKTFTGAFPEGPNYDESAYAKEVSKFAETNYEEIFIQGSLLPDILPRLIYFMDEPLAGPGLIPQYFVSELAGRNVKVVLGGQGGDELFIGYSRYLVAYLERCLSGAIFGSADDRKYAVTLESIIPNLPLLKGYTSMVQGFMASGMFEEPDRRYFRLVDRSEGMSQLFSSDLLENEYSAFCSFQEIFNRVDLHSFVNQMCYFDLKGSLPALLHVEDRTSMAASIESRVPLLDHRIVEFIARVPPNIKFAGGESKYLFKKAIKHVVPHSVFERKDKMGFPTPFNLWASGVAHDFVRDILLSDRVRQRGIYNFNAIEGALNNERQFGRVVWGLLCLELWYRTYIDGDFL